MRTPINNIGREPWNLTVEIPVDHTEAAKFNGIDIIRSGVRRRIEQVNFTAPFSFSDRTGVGEVRATPEEMSVLQADLEAKGLKVTVSKNVEQEPSAG